MYHNTIFFICFEYLKSIAVRKISVMNKKSYFSINAIVMNGF